MQRTISYRGYEYHTGFGGSMWMNDYPKREKNAKDGEQEQAEARATDDGMPVVHPEWQKRGAHSWKAVTPKQRIADVRKRMGMGFLPNL